MSKQFPKNIVGLINPVKAKYNLESNGISKSNNSNLIKTINHSSQTSLSTSCNSRTDLCKNGDDDDNSSETSNFNCWKHWKKYTGILLTLLASAIFSSVTLIAKVLSGPEYGYNSYSSAFWRYVGVLVPSIPLLMHYECGLGKKVNKESGESISVFSSIWPLSDPIKRWTFIGVMSRGIFGGASIILRFYALQYLTLGDTAVITYSTPVLVCILAHFFLGEKIGIIPIILAILTLCGVVFITRPPFLTGTESFDTNTLIGTSFATGSLLCSAVIIILTRKFKSVHYSVMTGAVGLIGVIEAFTLTQIFQDFHSPSELMDTSLVTTMALFSFLGQMVYILALKVEQAGPVSLIRSCDVIFGFILQFIFLGVKPDLMSTIGGSIVLGCVLITGLRKWVSGLPEENKQKTRCRFVLL